MSVGVGRVILPAAFDERCKPPTPPKWATARIPSSVTGTPFDRLTNHPVKAVLADEVVNVLEVPLLHGHLGLAAAVWQTPAPSSAE